MSELKSRLKVQFIRILSPTDYGWRKGFCSKILASVSTKGSTIVSGHYVWRMAESLFLWIPIDTTACSRIFHTQILKSMERITIREFLVLISWSYRWSYKKFLSRSFKFFIPPAVPSYPDI